MPLAYWMILVAAFLPYAAVALAKSGGNFDNEVPRQNREAFVGWHKRADWAHQNHFETFPIFAAAVLVAEQTHAAQGLIDALAVAYIVVRIVYTAVYIAGWGAVRSIVFTLGLAITVWLYLAAL